MRSRSAVVLLSIAWAASATSTLSVARRAAADGTAGAAAGPLTIATEWVSLDVPRESGAPFRADLGPAPIEVSDRVPASLASPLQADGRVLYAEMPRGRSPQGGKPKKTGVALVLGGDASLTVFVDADGDGALAPGEAIVASKGSSRYADGHAWRVADAKVGDAHVALAVQQMPYAFAGWIKVEALANEMPIGDARLAFTGERPASMAKAPELPGRVLYASGTVDGKTIAVAVARGAGDALTLLVDADADGRWTAPAERRELAGSPVVDARGGSAPRRIGTSWATPDGLTMFGRRASVQMSEIPGEVTATVAPVGSRRGKATVGGAPYELYLLDADFDGCVDSPADLWWFGPAGAFTEDRQPMYATLYAGDEPVPATGGRGVAWRLVSAGPDGTAVVRPAADAAAPELVEAYLRGRTERVNRSRWFPKFDGAAREFAAKHHLDGGRPKASAPPAWRFSVDFDGVVALAAKEGKPLLVDFEADWCEHCKELDYYTYPDQEVAEWVSKFTAVKMNRELDETRAFYRFQDPDGKPWKFIPCVAVFGGDGRPVPFTFADDEKPGTPPAVVNHVSWLKPESLVKALRAAYAAWEASPPKRGGPPPAPGSPAPPSMK